MRPEGQGRPWYVCRDCGEAYEVMGRVCGLCGEAIRWTGAPGAFWEAPPVYVGDAPFHTGCLHPEVILVREPFGGNTIPLVEAGRLRGFERGRDGWWLTLDRTVSGYESVALNWSRIVRVELRHER